MSPPLLALVDAQWGVVARGQLRALGLSDGTVTSWLRTRRLRPLHRGVYAVGHDALRAEGRWLAAVLACGPGAMLSHRSAAALLDLLPYASATIHVTAPRSRHQQRGIRLHRARSLDALDTTTVRGIPTTAVPRTALDLAATEPPHRTERLLAQADRLGIYDGRALDDVIARNNGHRGTGALGAHLHRAPLLTRSELEAILLQAARARGIEDPLSDHPIHLPQDGPITVDFYFPSARLIIEADSWRHHRSRASFEDDRARDLELTALGYRVVRLTARQLRAGAAEVLALVAALLASRG
ncbi:MAG: DUF559 domain-containing protein [Solirubrobacteraceae bacterium]